MRFGSILIILSAVFTVFFQLIILNSMEIASIKPDFIFIWVLVSSFYLPLRSALFTNWVLGILVDIFSNSTLGSFGFLYLLSGIIISLLREIFFREGLFARLGIALISSFACHFIYGISLSIFKSALGFWFVLAKSGGIALYTTLIGFFFFLAMDAIERLVLAKRLREELRG